MCGISGIFNLETNAAIDESLLKHINRVQSHRGPDDEGYFIDSDVGLGHRRLSIIDLSSGQQPIFNEDQSVCVVFNGEIYNFESLVAELSCLGHRFSTHSDTEVIVHAWEEWGVKCLERFRGMFAFALWDRNKKRLFLARDRLGKKPLYYTKTTSGQFIFGSELKVLLAHPDVDTRLREQMAEEFFMYGYIPEPFSAYKNVYKLNAGHYMLLEPCTKIQQTRYWDLPVPTKTHSWEDVQTELIERLNESVRIRLLSDVPLGAFLSGGVDSSAITALMAGLQETPVNTCAIGFNERDYDESDYANQIAVRYQTNHISQIVSSNDYHLIDRLSTIYDEPFADSSALPTYQVCQLARQNVKVALSGDGGDEVFAGYRRQRMHLTEQRLRDKIPLHLRKSLFGGLASVYPKADWAPKPLRAKTTLQSLAMNTVEAYANTMSKLRAEQRHQLFHPDYLRRLNGYSGLEIMRQHAKAAPTDDPLKQIQYLDIKTWLPGDILTKVDRASMAHSLEVRSPLLDHVFVEWAFSIKSTDNIRGTEGKYAFKKALEPYVDSNILYRPKMGFSIPIAEWFRGPLKHSLSSTILSENMLDSGFFSADTLKKMINEHIEGKSNHADALWCLLMFAKFMNRQ
ncbi:MULTISPECIES: XrtA/PEP-CTERM system amidotransferase [Vibrio]|jgi:asparagine synthase (glutamine-hydrolysing)|uniref:XrtA/PEP-CTERM system amidotransferase n=1 Tax=Vibrio TaxID=662 RepID=UPI000BFF83E5|nr:MULTISPECIES: XrtA/PEP-CTERM system amidotransferase [unclassified Vibrio]PHJ41842.1 asparagine synthase [Vibrio sp. PID17_43]RIZ53017.1 asparagine synthase [Vibrio sp. PID23_8]